MTSEQLCFENEKATIKKAAKLAEFIRHSKYFVVFTGPEISFAPSLDEVIEDISSSDENNDNENENENEDEVRNEESKKSSLKTTIPSLAHMALAKLYEEKILKFVITLNTDGLHIKSGIPRDKVAELRGNNFVEICDTCGQRYERDYDVQSERETEDSEHFCEQPNCGGNLSTNVVSSLSQDILQSSLAEARQHMQETDLCLCLGISVVSSAVSELLISAKKRSAKLVLVTLHRTDLERHADLRIHALCDDVMFLVMQALDLDIPSYITTTSDNQTIEITFDHYTFQGEEARKRFNQSDLDVDLWEDVATDANSKDFIAKKTFAKTKKKAKEQWKRKWSRSSGRASITRRGSRLSDGENSSEDSDEKNDPSNLASSLPPKLRLLELTQTPRVDHWKRRLKRRQKSSGPNVGPVWNPNRGLGPHLPESSPRTTNDKNDTEKDAREGSDNDSDPQDIETLRLEYEDPFALISSSLPSNTSKPVDIKKHKKTKHSAKRNKTNNNNNNNSGTKSEETEVDLSLL